ncbi:MAG: hypothetical protein E7623_06895 [Ruminococcaceae bacterium]|nr:hypothetical protein [Oscillospiraceae bacterium]
MNELKKLYTEDGEKLQGIPHSEYPRPHMVRDSFFCLNGEWEYGTSHSGSEQYGKKILVPFCPGSLLSGIDEVPSEDHFLWYKRSFRLPEGFKKDRVLLHFGAVDAECEVFLNDVKIGYHRGGYHHFTFDITKELAEENMLSSRYGIDSANAFSPTESSDTTEAVCGIPPYAAYGRACGWKVFPKNI